MAEAEKPDDPATGQSGFDSDAAAVGVALGRASRSGDIDAKAAQLLDKQSRMLDLRMEHFRDQQALYHRHLALKYFGDRLRIGLELLAIAFGAIVVIGLGALVWQAHQAHGLVVEAFSVPPDMARDGLTGEVVASQFLGKLQAMQNATNSERPADSYQNNWGSQIKVEIPQTGLNFSEFERLLRAKFGHASLLTGDVFRTPAGLAITAQVGDEPLQTFTGAANDIDTLTRKAAEGVYRTSQPYRFAQYLAQHDRGAEAFSVISDLALNGPDSERGWAFALWGLLDLNLNGDLDNARRHLRKSLALRGAQLSAAGYLSNVEIWAGHDEQVLEYLRMEDKGLDRPNTGYTRALLLNQRYGVAGYISFLFGDYADSALHLMQGAKTPDFLGTGRAYPAMAATAYALDHDPTAATTAIEPLEPNDDVSFLTGIATFGAYALPAYSIAAARDDWPAALAAARASDAWLEARKPTQKLMGLVQQVWVRPLEALAMARSGDIAGAESLITTTPADCYLCVRVRAQIAAEKKDWAGSEGWFALAARQAPSLPTAYSEWGAMRLAAGDLAGAIGRFEIAHQKGPHFADPSELWGEALMRRGDFDGAATKFEAADRDAPRWGRNHMLWGEALAKLGRAGEAREQWRAAAGMNLSVADRAELARLSAV